VEWSATLSRFPQAPSRFPSSAATRRVGACLNGFRKQILEFFEFKRVQPGPAQSAPVALCNYLGLPNRSKIDPKINQNIDVILVSFWVSLGSLLAPPFCLGRPNRSKFSKVAQRSPQEGQKMGQGYNFYSCFSKHRANPQEIERFWPLLPAPHRLKMAPSPVKMAEDRPKTTPRRF